MRLAREFRTNRNIKYEFHFTKLNERKLPVFIDFVDEVIKRSAAVSFRAVAVKRAGLDTDRALEALFTHLLLRGVEEGHQSGRAPMPRSLEFWKDMEDRNLGKVPKPRVTATWSDL